MVGLCVICHSSNIEEKTVNEMFWVGRDVILVPCRVPVCNDCGERYYSRQVIRHLEEVEERLRTKTLALETVGQVMSIAATSVQPALSVHEPHPDYEAEPPKPPDT